MAIRYTIERNHLKPGSYYPRALRGRRQTLAALIPNITAKTSLSASDVRGVITALITEIEAVVAAGDLADIDGLATFAIGLNGNLASAGRQTSGDAIQAAVNVHAAPRLTAAVKATLSLERVATPVKAPLITAFYDVATGRADVCTPGGIVRLRGKHLKFNPANLDEGVFLFDGVREQRLGLYAVNGRHQVDALAPPHLSGPLTVIVRARYTAQGVLREGRYAEVVACEM